LKATKCVLDKEAPGMAVAMLTGSLKVTPLAMLSRYAILVVVLVTFLFEIHSNNALKSHRCQHVNPSMCFP